ncbi:hypothetical protein KC959_03085 [Candidatus Saccharibacteria bacterium]|nr:hypothetical protein [Candidatus Saccharibacteria bacterium]
MIGTLFVYENVRVSDDRLTISFDYRVDTDEQTFALTETLKLPSPLKQSGTSDRILRALHLALGISYYKTFIPPQIDHAYRMDASEATFWNDVFRNGLGEFLYKNQLSAGQLARFEPQEGLVVPDGNEDIDWQNAALLGIGGGKDSVVAGELLKALEIPVTGFVLATGENRGQAQAVADVMGVEMLGVERRLDPQILDMNNVPGAYNGHVPISLVFALVGCLVACNCQTKYVVVANEASASIPHVEYEGSTVNHQWSKSLEFEKSFQDFVHQNISKQLHYTSVIRPLTSIAVAKIFAHYTQYFETFTSDNSLFKMKQETREHPRWSPQSSKSLSSFILLAPWMSDEDLERTFGTDFLNKAELRTLFLELLGRGEKPILDCVGTPDELRLSLSMLREQERFKESALMQVALDEKIVLENTSGPLEAALSLSGDHALPTEVAEQVQSKLKEQLA